MTSLLPTTVQQLNPTAYNNLKPAEMSADYDYCFKVILIGDSGVGKTSLLNRFADDFYTEEFIATIGVDFKIRTLPVNNKSVRMQFWDTAGQEKFRSITTCYFRSANGVVVVYDVCSPKSFYNIAEWMKTTSDFCSDNVVKIIIGNKCDATRERKISVEQGQKLAQQYGAAFAETSAQSDINVRRTFLEMAFLLTRRNDELTTKQLARAGSSTVSINMFDSGKRERGNKLFSCCSLQ